MNLQERGGENQMMHWGYGHEWVWLWMLVPTTFWILFLGLIAWGIAQFAGARREHSTAHGETAMDILERRYASGELDHDEFERRRQALQHPQ